MANCNCYKCNPCAPQNNCVNECVCTNPVYTPLGCIDVNSECIIYNGDTFTTAGMVKNQNLNSVLIGIKEALLNLQNLVPGTAYASNADAVAALGVGVLYKSENTVNGSPIILITV